MSNKRTLADLMDNDFFIDFEDTKVKAERKSLTESLTRSKRTLKESINESEVESCYKRICASAAEEKSRVIDHIEGAMIAVEVSKEHLKKALKLGAFGTYTGNKPHTVPAQYVESVDIEFMSNIQLETDYSLLSVQLHGEYNDENVIDYIGDVCNVQFREYQEFDTDEEALEFFEKEIRSNATKIAEEMIDEAWAECGCTDYEGITDLSGNTDYSNDDLEDDGGTDTRGKTIKPDFSNWETLIETADMLLTGLTHNSGNDNYDDGDGYWVTEYTVWCQRYLYYTDELNNEAKLKTLCDEYSKKLPGVTFYYNIDADEELCEIGYEASKQVDEGITDNKQGTPTIKEGFYKDTYDMTKDKISEKDLYKALVTDGELVSLNAGDQGKQVSFKDKGRYSDTTYEITEYDGKFSIAEFHNSDDGDWSEGDYYFETDSFETLCAELEKLFPGALVECKMTEEVEEPDNAVVDCKVNKVIAHCEDEKPVDCLGKKKPLEKPLTEEASEIIYLSHALREEIAICACDLDKIKQLDLEACKIYEDAYDAGLVDGAREERKLCRQYGVKNFSRADLFDALTKNAKVDWDTIEWTYQKEIKEGAIDCHSKKKHLTEENSEKPLNSLVKDLEYTATPTELEKARAEIKKLYGEEVLKDDESLPQIFTLYKELTGMNASEVEQRRDQAVKQNKCRNCGGDLDNLVCTSCGTKHQADGSDRDVGNAHANVSVSFGSGFNYNKAMNSADDFLNFYAVVHKLRQERQLDVDNDDWTKNDPQAKRKDAVIKFASEESKNRLKAEIEKQKTERHKQDVELQKANAATNAEMIKAVAPLMASAQRDANEAKKMTADELKAKYGTDDVDIINAGREEQDRVELKEARSVAEIKAEIAKLQQELADAEVEEKKARIVKRPEVVYVWDIYLDPAEKGNWFSAEEDDFTGMWEGTVYETADAAIRAGNLHLDELWDEGDLEYSRRDYYIDAYDIPLGNVSDETLSFSGLDHLIESLKERLSEDFGDDAYSSMMKVQEYIQSILGWDIIDCQQDDEDSMMLYCDGAWDDNAIVDLENFASDNGVDISVVDSGKSSYTYRVYLSC